MNHEPPARPATRRLVPWDWIALAAVVCAGAALRLPRLDVVPPGLWFDEALNGQDAVAVWQPGGRFRLVYPDVFPREPLFETLLALAVRAGGPRVVVMRTVSAAVGLITILLLYGMLRSEAGRWEAFTGAGVLATLRWHAIFSRLVFRTLILGPWMIGLTWAALAFRRRPTTGRALLVGALVGGGFYTYLAWYFLLPVVAGLLVWLAWPGRAPARQLAVLAAAAAIVFLPLGIHYLEHPDHLLSRAGAVSPLAGGPGAAAREVLKNARDAALMFHWRGDHVPKHNIPWKPALDPVQGIAFLYGLVLAGVGVARRRPLPAILLGWLVCGVAVTVFTKTDSPNFLRTLCITPAVAAIAGLGLADAARRVAARWRPAAGAALIVALLGASFAWTARDVYARWPARGDVWRGFNGDLAQLAREAARAPEDVVVYVPRQLFEHRSFQFQTIGARNVFPYDSWVFLEDWPPTGRERGRPAPRERWVIVTANTGVFEPLQAVAPGGRVAHLFRAPEGNAWAALYAIPEAARPDRATLEELARRWGQREMGF